MKETGRLVLLAHSGVGIEGGVVEVEAVGPVSLEAAGEGGAVAASTGGETEGQEIEGGEEARVRRALQMERPIGEYGGVRISVRVETTSKTGVEMEALVGVWGAALNAVDMVKGVDRGSEVGGVKVVGKRGGRRGGWGVWEGEEEYGVERGNIPRGQC